MGCEESKVEWWEYSWIHTTEKGNKYFMIETEEGTKIFFTKEAAECLKERIESYLSKFINKEGD